MNKPSPENRPHAASALQPRRPEGNKLQVRWTLLNKDLGKYHNAFIEEFPNCLFVRVLNCGPECTLKNVGAGGIALIREEVMVANAPKIKDNGVVRVDRNAAFLISEDDIIAFGKFGGSS